MNPIPGWLEKLWDAWDIRAMVLTSLMLQLTLIYFGGRRKNIRGIWLDALVWSTYLMADSTAVFSLGKLSEASSDADCENKKNVLAGSSNGLMVLWAPILLIHLGGPDTITAYSIEDIRLWLRHALNLFFQVNLAIYVFVRFWTGRSEWVAFLTLPLFVAGVVKYSERTLVLWSTNSVFPQPVLPIEFRNYHVIDGLNHPDSKMYDDAKLVALSYLWLQAVGPSILSSGNFDPSTLRSGKFNRELASPEVIRMIWEEKNINKAFKFFEIQLGFLHDVYYTKANSIYTRGGCVVRLVSFICVASAFAGFIIMNKHDYDPIDVTITYVLLLGAVILELYAILLIIFSDFAIVWMCKHCKYSLVKSMLRTVAPLVVRCAKRWTCSLPTLNLLDLAIYEIKPSIFRRVVKYFDFEETFKTFMCQVNVHELEFLRIVVMKEVKILFQLFSELNNWHRYYDERGQLVLEYNRHVRHRSRLLWSLERSVDFSIVIWHIATNCCYYIDDDNDPAKKSLREGSKILSDYMLYLLVNYPSLVGDHISTCNLNAILSSYIQLIEDAKREGIITKDTVDKATICRKMLKYEPNICTAGFEESTENLKSLEYGRILIDAIDIATYLMDECRGDKWEIISGIWAEMLFHGAVKCEQTQHLHNLPKGGEFISQAWLLLYTTGMSNPSPRDFLRPLFSNDVARSASNGDNLHVLTYNTLSKPHQQHLTSV